MKTFKDREKSFYFHILSKEKSDQCYFFSSIGKLESGENIVGQGKVRKNENLKIMATLKKHKNLGAN